MARLTLTTLRLRKTTHVMHYGCRRLERNMYMYGVLVAHVHANMQGWTHLLNNVLVGIIPTHSGSCSITRTNRQTNRQTDVHTDTQTDRQTERQTDRHTQCPCRYHTHPLWLMFHHTDRQTDRQTDRRADRQTHRQTDRQTHTHTQCPCRYHTHPL